MKKLYYRRHSAKDGTVKNTIGLKGLDLATHQGRLILPEEEPGKLFHGPLVRTAQTALAFCQGLEYVPDVMPVVAEIGTDELLQAMATEEFRAAVKGGRTNFQAVFESHQPQEIKHWAALALAGVKLMFNQMDENDLAIAFGHSPMIELAAWAITGGDLPLGHLQLGDLEGLIFIQKDGQIYVGDKIAVTP